MSNYIYKSATIIRVLSNNIESVYTSRNKSFLTRCFSTTLSLSKKGPAPAAAPTAGAALKGPKLDKKKIPVESDPDKLINYVCGTDFMKEDTEPVQVKDDSEYPDWLWEVRLGRRPPLEELDENTKDYWKQYFKQVRQYKERLKSLRRF